MSVTVTGLTKRFVHGGPPAVREVSFSAPTGAITTLLGPSGSGKTTVLRMIAGLEEPESGRIEIAGQDCTRVPVRARGVGFVFQGYALFSHLTVRKNIAFGLKVQKLPARAIAERVEELLGLVQLGELGDRYPAQLSGGQRQRVAFARALATRPKVLLLDEPFGALDARVRVELREWLRELNERTQVTTVLVTHDQEEALELSGKVVVMHEGVVAQAGAPHDIYDAPATPFVASFIGSASVIRGRVEAGRLAVGSVSMSAPDGAADGTSVSAFVRPHDIKIARADALTLPVSLGCIEAVTRVGGYVKVELRLPSGEAVTLQMARGELEALGVGPGDRVMVELGEAKLFVGDYSI